MRPSQGYWGIGEKGYLFQGNEEQRSNFEGNRGTKTILGNREHKKTHFRFLGKDEQANLFQGNKGTGTPPPTREGLNHNFQRLFEHGFGLKILKMSLNLFF